MRKYLKSQALLLSLLFSQICLSQTEVDYSEKSDEFGDSKVQQLILATDDRELGAIIISCYSGQNLQAQLNSKKTIFPNESRDGAMYVNTTYKVDTAKTAITQEWKMTLMKYKSAWQLEGTKELISDMIKGNKLSVRLDKSGHIFRFDLKDTKQYLLNITNACS